MSQHVAHSDRKTASSAKKRSHTQAVCRSKLKLSSEKGGKEHHVKQLQTPVVEKNQEYELCQLHGDQTQPLEVQVGINGHPLLMELDTGAAVLLVSESVFSTFCPEKTLQSSSSHLRTYSGEKLFVLGQLDVDVQCGDQHTCLPLHVVSDHGSSLLGRDWLC